MSGEKPKTDIARNDVTQPVAGYSEHVTVDPVELAKDFPSLRLSESDVRARVAGQTGALLMQIERLRGQLEASRAEVERLQVELARLWDERA